MLTKQDATCAKFGVKKLVLRALYDFLQILVERRSCEGKKGGSCGVNEAPLWGTLRAVAQSIGRVVYGARGRGIYPGFYFT